ncbi:peptidase family S58-domain-containing protein [Cryomyces antarcticus]
MLCKVAAVYCDGDVVKGVTLIFPRHPDEIQVPCYAGMHTLNGNGEVTGSYQIKDWGFINTPVALTNSLSLGIVYHTIWQWMIAQSKRNGQDTYNMGRHYGTPVVGETADWGLNDIYRSALLPLHVDEALSKALTRDGVQEGQFGGGAGMTCHQFTGGTGTSSRVVKGEAEEYTVGVLVQSNYGHLGDLRIGGVPIGKLLAQEKEAGSAAAKQSGLGPAGEGSCVILIFTDAPMLPHQLTRLAQRASIGLSQVGGHGTARNFSGDIFLAVSTANRPTDQLAGPTPSHAQPRVETWTAATVKNESVEATEEAVLNSMVAGREGRTGFQGFRADGLPVERVRALLEKYLVIV